MNTLYLNKQRYPSNKNYEESHRSQSIIFQIWTAIIKLLYQWIYQTVAPNQVFSSNKFLMPLTTKPIITAVRNQVYLLINFMEQSQLMMFQTCCKYLKLKIIWISPCNTKSQYSEVLWVVQIILKLFRRAV